MVYLTVMLAMVGLAACDLDQKLEAKYREMSPLHFMDFFNHQNYLWQRKQYPNFFFQGGFMTFDFTNHDHRSYNIPIKFHDPNIIGSLPENFDSRKKWPQCVTIGEIYQQGKCNSCWTHGVANTASDRFCIHKGRQVRLSEQDLECSHPDKTICYEGKPVEGFQFWKHAGLVTRTCKPYVPQHLDRHVCIQMCVNDSFINTYSANKHYAEEVYFIPNDSYQIKAELYLRGPIQAMMALYQDFIDERNNGYSSGIYEHKHGKRRGFHSVRVIGYGIENGVEYWLAANSWGTEWGEQGFFRVKAFQKDLFFEHLMLSGMPK